MNGVWIGGAMGFAMIVAVCGVAVTVRVLADKHRWAETLRAYLANEEPRKFTR